MNWRRGQPPNDGAMYEVRDYSGTVARYRAFVIDEDDESRLIIGEFSHPVISSSIMVAQETPIPARTILMPQASDEARALMTRWFGDISDSGQLSFLKACGYTERQGWIFKPTPAHTISEYEGECIDFLCDDMGLSVMTDGIGYAGE